MLFLYVATAGGQRPVGSTGSRLESVGTRDERASSWLRAGAAMSPATASEAHLALVVVDVRLLRLAHHPGGERFAHVHLAQPVGAGELYAPARAHVRLVLRGSHVRSVPRTRLDRRASRGVRDATGRPRSLGDLFGASFLARAREISRSLVGGSPSSEIPFELRRFPFDALVHRSPLIDRPGENKAQRRATAAGNSRRTCQLSSCEFDQTARAHASRCRRRARMRSCRSSGIPGRRA